MKSFEKYLEEKNKGLWDNIHAKRKRGEKMRKPGSKGAPTDADFKRSQEESVDEKKLTPAELKKREEIAKAMERDNPGMDMGKKMAIATATAKKVAEEVELEEGVKTHFVYQKGVSKTKEVVHRGTEQSSRDWIEKNAKHFTHKGKDFDIYKGKYPNVKPSDRVDFRHVAEEAEQIDEISADMKNRYMNRASQAATSATMASKYTKGAEKEKFDRIAKNRKAGIKKVVGEATSDKDRLCKECGDQFGKPTNEKCMYDAYDTKGENWVTKEMYEGLDITEISLNMLTKKISSSGLATTKKANNMDKTKKDLKDLRDRLAGKKVATEAKEDDEPASPDEAGMAMKQLEFIEYAAEEMMDHIKSGKAFPEWFQNKLSKAHGEIEGLHSAMGEHGGDEEDVKEAVRKGAPKMTGDSFKQEREKSKAHDAAMGRTATGRKKPVRQMTSTQKWRASANEAVMSADRKPEKFVKPDGKVGIRMVSVDKKVVDKDA